MQIQVPASNQLATLVPGQWKCCQGRSTWNKHMLRSMLSAISRQTVWHFCVVRVAGANKPLKKTFFYVSQERYVQLAQNFVCTLRIDCRIEIRSIIKKKIFWNFFVLGLTSDFTRNPRRLIYSRFKISKNNSGKTFHIDETLRHFPDIAYSNPRRECLETNVA